MQLPNPSAMTPNPSFEARPNGKPPGPAPGEVYRPSAGPGALPSVPPQLEPPTTSLICMQALRAIIFAAGVPACLAQQSAGEIQRFYAVVQLANSFDRAKIEWRNLPPNRTY